MSAPHFKKKSPPLLFWGVLGFFFLSCFFGVVFFFYDLTYKTRSQIVCYWSRCICGFPGTSVHKCNSIPSHSSPLMSWGGIGSNHRWINAQASWAWVQCHPPTPRCPGRGWFYQIYNYILQFWPSFYSLTSQPWWAIQIKQEHPFAYTWNAQNKCVNKSSLHLLHIAHCNSPTSEWEPDFIVS